MVSSRIEALGVEGAAEPLEQLRVALVPSWDATPGGVGTDAGGGGDFESAGAFVTLFYNDPSRATQNDFSLYETHPFAGVSVIEIVNGQAMPAHARYFGAARDQLDPAASVTGATGGAVVPIARLSAFSGQGPSTMKWEGKSGGAAPHLVWIERFHPN